MEDLLVIGREEVGVGEILQWQPHKLDITEGSARPELEQSTRRAGNRDRQLHFQIGCDLGSLRHPDLRCHLPFGTKPAGRQTVPVPLPAVVGTARLGNRGA